LKYLASITVFLQAESSAVIYLRDIYYIDDNNIKSRSTIGLCIAYK